MKQLLKEAHICFLELDTIVWEDMIVFDPRDDFMPYFVHIYMMRYMMPITGLVEDLYPVQTIT